MFRTVLTKIINVRYIFFIIGLEKREVVLNLGTAPPPPLAIPTVASISYRNPLYIERGLRLHNKVPSHLQKEKGDSEDGPLRGPNNQQDDNDIE